MGGTRIRVAGLVIGLGFGLARGAYADADADDEIEMGEPAAKPPAAPVKDPAAAKKHVATAKQLVQKGDAAARAKKVDDAKASYESAVSAYDQAIEAGGEANLHYDVGLVEEKLGKLASAAVRYRRVIKAGVRPDVVKKATARFDDVTTKIGLVMLVVKPDGATISIAGKQVGTAPLAEPLALMPGAYTFTLEAEGHAPKESELVVEPGSESERTIELEVGKGKVAPTPADPTSEEPVAAPASSGPSRTPMFVAGGTAVGLIAIGAITGILAVGEHGTFDSMDASPAERTDARDAGKRYALITDLCIGGAVVAGGIAAYWYFARYKPARHAQATERREARRAPGPQINAKVDVVPWVKPDAGGFVLAGQF